MELQTVLLTFYILSIFVQLSLVEGNCIYTQMCLLLSFMFFQSFPHTRDSLDRELAELAFNLSHMLYMVLMTTFEPLLYFLFIAILYNSSSGGVLSEYVLNE